MYYLDLLETIDNINIDIYDRINFKVSVPCI